MPSIAFVNGLVRTMRPAEPTAGAVLIDHGRIVAVGRDAEVHAAARSSTEVVDLHGRTLLPGLHDSHVHPTHAGREMMQCDLTALPADRDAYVARVATYAATHPEVSWITGAGWAMDAFPGGIADASGLDQVVPDRPVFLWNRDHHGAWVNSKAMALAGITPDTPDPADGRIERAADGSAVGTLQEGATDLVEAILPAVTPQDRIHGLLTAQRHLLSLGITGWQDAWVGVEDQDAYVTIAERGSLRARVVGARWWDRHRGTEQIADIIAGNEKIPPSRYRGGTVKIMQDGVCENHTASLLATYLDADGAATGNDGISFIDPEDLMQFVAELDRLGFQVHFHALGDRAVRECLDAVEHAATSNGHGDRRHHLAHLQLVDPADRARFATLGAGASAQPLWAHHDGYQDDLTIPFLGRERAAMQYPWRSLLDAGAVLALGSDWPVSTADPWQIMHVAVHRHHPSGADAVFYPEERITPLEALAGYTAGSTWVNHRDHDLGTIEPGKLGDVIVVDADPIEHGFLGRTVDMTVIDGEVVHGG